jgi:hypothetical protein
MTGKKARNRERDTEREVWGERERNMPRFSPIG